MISPGLSRSDNSLGFAVVASLASLPLELDKEEALRLAGELSELRLGAELLDLDDDTAQPLWPSLRAVLRAHARRRVVDVGRGFWI